MSTKPATPAKPPATAKPAPPPPAPSAPLAAALPGSPGAVLRVQTTLLEPLGTDEHLIGQFKRYIELKDKLLEDTDYIWSVRWQIGGEEDSKFFKRRAQAETWAEGLRKKGIEPELEKKIKKSGCMKLGKAFGISDWPTEEALDRTAGSAYYKVRAEAPNGQYKERTGACDRLEKGKAKASFDTIMATALTRAADRAIMALLGGETTAEEFEGAEVADTKPSKVQAPPLTPQEEADINAQAIAAAAKAMQPRPATHSHTCPTCGAIWGPCDCQTPDSPHHSAPCPVCAHPLKATPLGAPESPAERLATMDAKFGTANPAAPNNERLQLNRRLWAAAGALYGKGGAEAKVHATIVQRYKRESLRDLTDEEFKALALGVEGYAKAQGKLQ